jgi:hypothetical protein
MLINNEFIDIYITSNRVNNIKDGKLRNYLLSLRKLNLKVTKIILPTRE